MAADGSYEVQQVDECSLHVHVHMTRCSKQQHTPLQDVLPYV